MTVIPPVTLAEICLAKPEPGSKKPDPPLDVPVTFTITDDKPVFTPLSTEDGLAGGGAVNLATSRP